AFCKFTAASQPPEYHFQLTPTPSSRSPMFSSNGRFGSLGLLSLMEFSRVAAPGVTKFGTRFAENVVLTSYLPSMVRLPSFSAWVVGSKLDWNPAGIGWFHWGAAAATRNWWLRNDPP